MIGALYQAYGDGPVILIQPPPQADPQLAAFAASAGLNAASDKNHSLYGASVEVRQPVSNGVVWGSLAAVALLGAAFGYVMRGD